MKRILIIGANSAIAEATARIWAAQGCQLYLLGRSAERLCSMVSDLKVRGAALVDYALLDCNNFEQHAEAIITAAYKLGAFDVVLVAHGTLGNQKACEFNSLVAINELNTNTVSVISLLTHVANIMEEQRFGSIVVISSVAGDRGRRSNYVYGAAKGAVTIFLQGMRNRLHSSDVHVLTVKPGFVDTPMTVDFKKNFLWVKPELIANIICVGVEKKKDVIYAPWYWWWIMVVIKSLPECVFKRMKL